MPLTAVTLDAAGTLFAPREPVGVTYARLGAACGIALDPVAAGGRFHDAMRAASPLAFPGVPPARRQEAERDWWRQVVRATFGAAASLPKFASCFDGLWEHFARPDAWALDEGARDTLTTLRARGLRIAIVSNFDTRLLRVLSGLGIAPLVDAVVPSAAYDFAKPDPRLFATAARLLGARADGILHVGDDVELDVRGALAAGFRAMLLCDASGTAPPGVPVLRRLRDLPDAL